MNEALVEATRILRTVARRVPQAHTVAWWPYAGMRWDDTPRVATSTPTSPMLQVGDDVSLERFVQLLSDINLLLDEVAKVAIVPRLPNLHRHASAFEIRTRVLLLLTALVTAAGEDVDQNAAWAVLKRVDKIGGHVDGLLSVPRRRRVTVTPQCSNPRERERCQVTIANAALGLCRSCENHEQYRRKRNRQV